jgi:hypothetical protein
LATTKVTRRNGAKVNQRLHGEWIFTRSESRKPQAASRKPQAASRKPQAASSSRQQRDPDTPQVAMR